MEERREANAKIISFMATAAEKLENIHIDIVQLNNKVGIQNGRVVKLEEWKQIIEQKIQQRKDNYNIIQAIITVVATVVMAISALVMIFKK